MFFTFEVSRPFQWKPGFFRKEGVTSWRVWWGWFAIACHPMRFDEMMSGANQGVFVWSKRA